MIKSLNLTTHAVERLMGRFGVKVSAKKFNINTTDWMVTRRTTHNVSGAPIQYMAYTAGKVRMVMVVAVECDTIMTVMSEGKMVDACYAYVARNMVNV